MERLKRYVKQIVAVMSAFIILVGGVLSTSFQSDANELDKGLLFNLNYPEPTCSDTQGYVLLLLKHNTTGVYYVQTFFWNMVANSSSSITPCYAYLDVFTNGVKINIGGSSATTGAYLSVFNYGTTGNLWFLHASNNSPYEWRSNDYTVIDYRYRGNVGYVGSQIGSGTNKFTVYFNSDASALIMRDVWDILHAIYQQNSSIGNSLINIYNSVDGLENQLSSVISYLQSVDLELDSIKSELQKIYDKAEEILQEEKKQTTWLEKIWNSIQEFLGLQGEESTEKLPDEEVNSVLEEEDQLMQDTTEAENSLDFSVDSNSNNVVWNVIERVLNANPRVFGAFIGIMTLGVITLLLNR